MPRAALFLAHGGDPNRNDAEPLLCAISSGNKNMVKLLQPHVRLEMYGAYILSKLKEQGSTSPLVEEFEKTVLQTTKPLSTKAEENPGKRTRVDEHTFIETQQLPDGMMLTTLFNFESCQQIVVFDKNEPGVPPAISVQRFDEVGDLDIQRQKMIDLGGTVDTVRRAYKPKPATAAQKGEM